MELEIKHTAEFIRRRRSAGKYAFTIDELHTALPKSKKNIQKDLDRLRDKGEILNVRRGFYTIIPDEYSNMGALPVELYANYLMKYLEKKYYAGLFSAAMLHGAAHQQPQAFYIVTDAPKPRNIRKDKFVINFSEKRKFPMDGIEEKKTDTGYLKVSNREMTFLDLIYFEKNLGGLNRIMTILDELKEDMKIANLREALKNEFPVTLYQRAGYILEHLFFKEKLSGLLEKKLKTKNIRTTLLTAAGGKFGEIDPKWRVQINLDLESEL